MKAEVNVSKSRLIINFPKVLNFGKVDNKLKVISLFILPATDPSGH